MLYIIENDFMTVSVNSVGAEIYSINAKNKEYLWQGDEEFWDRRAPLLFPSIGPFRSKRIDGKESDMPQHGFLRDMEFEVEEQNDTFLVLSAYSNDDTYKIYPFDFVVMVKIQIVGNVLETYYTVKNKDSKKMVYSFGLHPGFNCPLNENRKFEDYYIEFTEPKTLERSLFEKNGNGVCLDETEVIVDNKSRLYFDRDLLLQTIIFNNVEFNEFKFGVKDKGDIFNFTYGGDFNILAIWQAKDSSFVCFEPWRGYNGVYPHCDDLEDNKSVKFLGAGDMDVYSMSIEIY